MKKIWKIILAVLSLLVKDSRGENPTESEIWLNEETNKPVGFICTWEDGWCDGWYNVDHTKEENYVPNKFFDLVVRQGASSSPATGPAFDRTRKTEEGHYLLLEASQKMFLSQAEIASPAFDITAYDEYCFSMWYLMYGKHAYSLTAFVSIPVPGAYRKLLFKKSGQASKTATHWIYQSVTIKKPDLEPGHLVNITINAVRGLSYQSDIGMDDIMVRPGPCPDLPPKDATPPPPQTTASTKAVKSTQATTRAVVSTMDPMVTREFNPFFTPKIESCQISTVLGDKTEQYISNMFICCGNKIMSRLNGSKCCAGVQYFARKQDCCEGEVIDKAEFNCCGGKKTPVEPDKICCNGEIRQKEASLSCCDDKEFFDKGSQGCCIDKLYSKASSFCCGGSVLEKNDDTQKCCGSGWKGEKYSPGREACCNGNLYAVAQYGCCGETYVYSKLYEECHVPDAEENENGSLLVKLKEKQKWRKPSSQAGQFLFNYRKRRSPEQNGSRRNF